MFELGRMKGQGGGQMEWQRARRSQPSRSESLDWSGVQRPHVPGREATSALAFYVRFLCAPGSSFSTSYLASFRKSISS